MTQAFIANHLSLLPEAALTASSVRPAALFERTAVAREGNGTIRLAGAYTGSAEATVDIEVLNGGASPDATRPVFAGVGSGELAIGAVAPGAEVQEFVLTLTDLGVDSATAQLDLGSVVLRAKAGGAAGNQVRIRVAPALLRTATAFSLLREWAAGTAVQSGEQWDFGALPLSVSGELPAGAPRLRFGNDPAVYRQYKEFHDGQWRYGLSPALERAVPAGARVWAISGDYAVTVSDGTLTESHAVVTLHDLLTALSASALLEVAGVVAADRTPGGASAIDLPLRTSAWAAAAEGGIEYLPAVNAPTETVTFTCTESRAGADRWAVSGAVSGSLPAAVTGQVYAAGPVASALIPAKGKTGTVSGETVWKFTPTSREGDAEPPPVCLNPVKLGRNARAGLTATFVLTKRPEAKCKCDGKTVGAISNFLLGLEGESMSELDPALQSRATALYNWRRELVETHCGLATGATVPAAWAVKFRLVSTDTGFLNPWNTLGVGSEVEADTVVTQLGAASISPTTGNIDLPAGIAIFPGLVRYDGADVLPDGTNATIEDIAKVSVPAVTDPVAARVSLRDTTWLESVVTALVDALADVYTDATALAAWDGFFADAQAQAAFIAAAGDDLSPEELVAELYQRQQAQMDYVRVLAGILPKADASGGGGAVWRDDPSATHWWVDPNGRYLPAFSNKVYYSCLRDTGSLTGRPGAIVNLKEFAFGLVVPCEHLLLAGDSITVSVASLGAVNTSYQQGDTLKVDVVGAAPVWLSGGVTGDDTRTWQVSGSVSGALADLPVPAGGSAAATRAGVSLTLSERGIPFALGDSFRFSVEAGRFCWRRDGGAWSVAADLPAAGEAAALFDGVTAVFERGDAPSFLAGDRAAFAVRQPYSPEGVRRFSGSGWQWEGASAVLEADFGSVRSLGALALVGQVLPEGARLLAEGSADRVIWTAVAIDVSRRVAVGFLPEALSVRYLRLTLSDAAGGSLGWVWAGVPLTTTRQADSVRLRHGWAMARGAGVNPASLCAGARTGGEIGWSMLQQADVEAVLRLADHCQTRGEPLVFVPCHHYPDEAILARLAADEIEVDDWYEFQVNPRGERVLALRLPLAGVVA